MYDQLCAFCLLIFQHPFKFAVSMLSLSRLLRIIPFPFSSSTFPFLLGFEHNLGPDFFSFLPFFNSCLSRDWFRYLALYVVYCYNLVASNYYNLFYHMCARPPASSLVLLQWRSQARIHLRDLWQEATRGWVHQSLTAKVLTTTSQRSCASAD
jgi:hypothetical protein